VKKEKLPYLHGSLYSKRFLLKVEESRTPGDNLSKFVCSKETLLGT
jgi:hypothetical protein